MSFVNFFVNRTVKLTPNDLKIKLHFCMIWLRSMYVVYRSRNNAKDPNGQFCYKFLRLYKMICWIRHIFSFRIHDSLLMLWESLIHDFLPSIGFLCGERRRSIQTDLVIRFHAAAQRKIISNPLHLRVAFFVFDCYASF